MTMFNIFLFWYAFTAWMLTISIHQYVTTGRSRVWLPVAVNEKVKPILVIILDIGFLILGLGYLKGLNEFSGGRYDTLLAYGKPYFGSLWALGIFLSAMTWTFLEYRTKDFSSGAVFLTIATFLGALILPYYLPF